MRELTQKEIASLGFTLRVGPLGNRRLLWEWIQPVSESDLDYLMADEPEPDRLIKSTPDWSNPLRVRNWVAKHTDYISDSKLWGQVEHWPDPGQVIEHARDDCDGLGILTASILFSFAVKGVRLTLGTYQGGGHMWVEYWPELGPARLLETTGDDQVDALPLAADCVEYVPSMQAERTGPHASRIWVTDEQYEFWQKVGWVGRRNA